MVKGPKEGQKEGQKGPKENPKCPRKGPKGSEPINDDIDVL